MRFECFVFESGFWCEVLVPMSRYIYIYIYIHSCSTRFVRKSVKSVALVNDDCGMYEKSLHLQQGIVYHRTSGGLVLSVSLLPCTALVFILCLDIHMASRQQQQGGGVECACVGGGEARP